jgi:ArsR family transcriptional regulator
MSANITAARESLSIADSLGRHGRLEFRARVTSRKHTTDPQVRRGAAAKAVVALKLLANEDRLLLMYQLSQGEMCVSDLEQMLGIRQPTLSQQLCVLRNEGVVNTRRVGKNIFYSVAAPAMLEILAVLYRLYCSSKA